MEVDGSSDLKMAEFSAESEGTDQIGVGRPHGRWPGPGCRRPRSAGRRHQGAHGRGGGHNPPAPAGVRGGRGQAGRPL